MTSGRRTLAGNKAKFENAITPDDRQIMAGKTHNYARQAEGSNYIIEAIETDSKEKHFYMTAIGAGVKRNDYILLKEGASMVRYQVKQIDYYCEMSTMWIALLVQCPQADS
jgi:hypothetical protein